MGPLGLFLIGYGLSTAMRSNVESSVRAALQEKPCWEVQHSMKSSSHPASDELPDVQCAKKAKETTGIAISFLAGIIMGAIGLSGFLGFYEQKLLAFTLWNTGIALVMHSRKQAKPMAQEPKTEDK